MYKLHNYVISRSGQLTGQSMGYADHVGLVDGMSSWAHHLW